MSNAAESTPHIRIMKQILIFHFCSIANGPGYYTFNKTKCMEVIINMCVSIESELVPQLPGD